MPIVGGDRSEVVLSLDGRLVRVESELLSPMGGRAPLRGISARPLLTWDDGSLIAPGEKVRILRHLIAELPDTWVDIDGLTLEEAAGVSGALDAEYPLPVCEDESLVRSLRTDPGKAVFWCGREAGRSVRQIAEALASRTASVTFAGLRSARGSALPSLQLHDPVALAAWRSASAAFATGASGPVRVVAGAEVSIDCWFVLCDLPVLLANPAVTALIAVEAATGIERPLKLEP